MQGESIELEGICGVMWKLPGIYEDDPSDNSVIEDTESELAIFCSQAGSPGGLDFIQLSY